MKKLYKYGILLLLPFLLFYLNRLINLSFGDFYLTCVDPEYAYLFNGLCVAQLKLDLGYYFHPGTPLQCLIAITSIIANIGNRGLTLPENIFINPEYYLHASNLAINIINALCLFIIGYFIYQRSRNIVLALFIQASPFTSSLVLETMGRVIPESLMGIAGLLLLLLVFYYATKKDYNDNITKYIILFSLISGYGIALKLTYIPLIVIPLIIIPSLVNRLKYLFYTLISFFIFAFPLLGKLDKFWRWIRNLFVHSGLYGEGEANVINIPDFTDNIRLLISQDKIFFILLVFFVLVIIIYFIKPLKLDIQYKTLIGIVLTIIIQYLIVAKHYKLTYMIPVLCFSFFGIYLATEILFRPFQRFQITPILKNILYLLIIMFVVIHRYNKVMDHNKIRRQKVEKREQTSDFISNNLKEKTILLVPWYYGSAYIERGLVEGLFYSGRYKKEYGRLLKKFYPKTYFFLPWHNRYYDWNLKWEDGLDLEKFISENKNIHIYFGIKDTGLRNKIFNDLKACFPKNYEKPVEVYSNNLTRESIYRFR
jgi:hypothetical protein